MSQKKQKTILVTGGAGFVGSNLIKRLVADGHRVISLDNYFAGTKDAHVEGAEYREGHTKDIATLVPETPDIIFHLGEYARVEQSLLEPDVVHDLNVVGTEGVIAYWKKKKSKLVYAGSSTKFGDGGLARSATPYASSKADNTEKVKKIGDAENLPYAITYFYNVYGPGERAGVYGTVIEIFKQMYLRGVPITITSPGTQTRNFTHVDDIVDGLLLVAKKGQGDEYGLGNEKVFAMLDVARLFGTNILMLPERPGNRMSSSLDTLKSRGLGWEAERRLEDYVQEFLDVNPLSTTLEKRVLVFSTTFHPIAGPAEDALLLLMKRMPGVQFDVITSAFSHDAHKEPSPAPNATVYKVGNGNPSDKYLLPILGFRVARELYKKNKYLFAWSIFASYAALAAVFLKRMTHTPLLITLADQNLESVALWKRWLLRMLLTDADQVYGIESKDERKAARMVNRSSLRHSMGEGDAFANQIRFAYANILRADYKPKKKKVLIFSLVYYPRFIGGAEVALKEITDRLGNEFEFDMITLRKHAPAFERIGNVNVYRVGWPWQGKRTSSSRIFPLSKLLFPFFAVFKAQSLNRKHSYDGIWGMMAAYAGFAALFFKLLHPHTPYVLTLQEGDPLSSIKRKSAFVYPLFRRIFTKADRIQSISCYLGEFGRSMGFKGPLEIIPNGVDIRHFSVDISEKEHDTLRKKMNVSDHDTVLITSSRLVRKNAIDDCIRALKKLPEEVHFVVLGVGPDEQMLHALAKKEGVSKRVHFFGFIDHKELPAYLKASNIFVRPSRSEGMGNSFIEAFAAGIPVVATQEGGIADFLFDQKRNPEKRATGWAVDRDSPKQIVAAVNDILLHPEAVKRVTKNARELAERSYNWDTIAKDMRERVFIIF